MNIVKFEAKLKAGIKWDESANIFVTFAPALGLYSQGTTRLQAKRALSDAVNSFLVVAYEKNVLKTFLDANGAKEHDGHPDELRRSGEEYVLVQEQVLEKEAYEDMFDVHAQLPLAA